MAPSLAALNSPENQLSLNFLPTDSAIEPRFTLSIASNPTDHRRIPNLHQSHKKPKK
jgi:hypothetical protein